MRPNDPFGAFAAAWATKGNAPAVLIAMVAVCCELAGTRTGRARLQSEGEPRAVSDGVVAFSLTLSLEVVPVRIAKVFGGRRAKGDVVRAARYETTATLLDGRTKQASELVRGEVVVVEAGGWVPSDGSVIDGAAMVDESAITGESAPVLREPVGDRSAVVAGARVVSSRIVIKVR
jgi:potassium-transporting ATPase ATP-binding subunit